MLSLVDPRAPFAPVRRVRPNGQMFFLGAGFMLLETKGVVHMALLFGSTWMVNSIVFFAILVMILLSNLYVLALRPRRLWPYYALLHRRAAGQRRTCRWATFLALPGAAQGGRLVRGGLRAGLLRRRDLRRPRSATAPQPDVDFGSNIGGVILGGLSENLSLVVGFNHLLLLAIAYYVLSAVLGPRRQGVTAEIPVQSPV